jgi:hypothetical protein
MVQPLQGLLLLLLLLLMTLLPACLCLMLLLLAGVPWLAVGCAPGLDALS